MKLISFGLAALAAATALCGPALAREEFDNLFFVRTQGTAAGFFQDRASCRNQAAHMGDNAAAYTNPEYGALSAMGSALDEDALHESGLHDRMRKAIFTDCMKRLGWTPAEPTEAESHELMKASLRHPEPLNDWLKSHAPPPAPEVKTVASTPATPVKN